MFVTPAKLHNQQQHNLTLQNVHSHLHYTTLNSVIMKNITIKVFRMFTATYTTLNSVIMKNSTIKVFRMFTATYTTLH